MSCSAATVEPTIARNLSGSLGNLRSVAVTNQGLRKSQFRLSDDLFIEVHFKSTEIEPSWLVKWMKRLSDLVNLPDDWDSYGAKRISSNAVFGAINLVLPNIEYFTSAPLVFPHGSGGIQIEWHVGNTDLEVLALSEHQYRISHSKEGVDIVDDLMTKDPDVAIAALRELPFPS